MTEPMTFALAVIAILATPGPTNTLLFTAVAGIGPRAFRLLPAEITGYLIAILTIGWVIAPLVAQVHIVAIALRLLVAAYLLFVAIRLWRHAPQALAREKLVRFRDVFVTTLLNPKALLFALGIVPLHAPNAALYLAAFSALVIVIGGAWVGAGIAVDRGLLSDARRHLLPRAGATVIAGFAGYLVLTA